VLCCGYIIQSLEDHIHVATRSVATDAKKALRPGTFPATTGVDQVSPPLVDFVTRTTACPLVGSPVRFTPCDVQRVIGAMENDGNVRASWRKLDPGAGFTKSSVTVATVIFCMGRSCRHRGRWTGARPPAYHAIKPDHIDRAIGSHLHRRALSPANMVVVEPGLMGWGVLKVAPPSVEREKKIWSPPTPLPPGLANFVQARRPYRGTG